MKIWANSGDSHLVEPDDLFTTNLPKELSERMPRSEKDPDGTHETLYIDGQVIRRRMPRAAELLDENGQSVFERAPGANDMKLRLVDLDKEGIWAELVYPSIGIWMSSIQDPKLLAAGCAAINDWAFEYQRFDPRYVCTATIPLLDHEHAVPEIHRVADMGTGPRTSRSRPAWVPATGTTRTTGSPCGPRSRKPVSSSRSTSAPRRTMRRRCTVPTTAVPVGRSSTTWRPPTAASARSPR